MGGLRHGVALGRAHADAAQGAAVVVEADDGPAKSLVTHPLYLRRLLGKTRGALFYACDDIPGIGERGQVHNRKQEERLVGSAMAGRGRPSLTAFIGVETGKLFQVFID